MEVPSVLTVGMHRILFLSDIWPAGYPVNPKTGYRISGRKPDIATPIFFLALFEEKTYRKSFDPLNISRIFSIRPDIRQGNLVSGRIPDIKKRPDYPVHP
jgi:hypothetical protein